MGKEAIRLLQFAMRYPTSYHSVSRHDAKACRAVKTLEALDLVYVLEFGRGKNKQIKLRLGSRDGPLVQVQYLDEAACKAHNERIDGRTY